MYQIRLNFTPAWLKTARLFGLFHWISVECLFRCLHKKEIPQISEPFAINLSHINRLNQVYFPFHTDHCVSMLSLSNHQTARQHTIRARSMAGLEPFVPSLEKPWDVRRISHLLRRASFDAPPSWVALLQALSPQEAVHELIQASIKEPLPEPPPWYQTPPPPRSDTDAYQAYLQENRTWLREYRDSWLAEMQRGLLREKMALFWHNHFVTESRSYRLAPYAYQYLTVLRTHALGNFRTFVREVGLTPAMLIYLNGTQNRAGNPNENYARELLELFTMGLGHYTQQDIQEIARALTGWVVDNRTLSSRFIPARFDDGSKTIFGQTGSFGYDDVVDLIFQERGQETATFICRKLYRFFVYNEPDENIVAELTQTFQANDFEIAPVVEQLLSSAHFFDDAFIGAQIKAPVDVVVGLLNRLGHTPEDPRGYTFLARACTLLNQALFNPPNVAGWPGHHDWITTTTLPLRWLASDIILSGRRYVGIPDMLKLAEQLPDPQNPYQLAEDLASWFISVPLPASVREALPEILLAGTPDYEWDLYAPGAQERIRHFVSYLTQLPEFQLG